MSTLRTSAGLAGGVLLSLLAALVAWQSAGFGWNHNLQLSPLTLAILAGMLLGNTIPIRFIERMHPGLRFSQGTILRFGIILYGLRLTLNDVFRLGPRALALDVTIISCVLIAGFWIGTRLLGLDPDTALLVSVGSGICGAAAVLATEGVIESESHKASIAVATVVVFGTAAMFVYPLLYPLTGFTERQFGIYTGATVHEVAQVVAAGRAVSQAASDTAVITKMLRVLLLAPVLLIVGRIRRRQMGASSRHISFPWFVLWFGAVIAVQSLYAPPARVRASLIEFDTVLLSAAMFALGVGTRWNQLSRAGTRPLLLAAVLFAGLISGGFLLTRLFLA
jgi:uncharacterized integral membrane protein (TIGR00698 family)